MFDPDNCDGEKCPICSKFFYCNPPPEGASDAPNTIITSTPVVQESQSTIEEFNYIFGMS